MEILKTINYKIFGDWLKFPNNETNAVTRLLNKVFYKPLEHWEEVN